MPPASLRDFTAERLFPIGGNAWVDGVSKTGEAVCDAVRVFDSISVPMGKSERRLMFVVLGAMKDVAAGRTSVLVGLALPAGGLMGCVGS